MLRYFLAAALLLVCVCAAASNDTPELFFNAGETWLRGGPQGLRWAWLGMLREWDGNHARIRYVRGFGPIPSEGLSLGNGKNTTHSIWTVAAIATDAGFVQASPDAQFSPQPIEVLAIAGEAEIKIRSGVVFGTYTRTDGTTWSFSAGDADPTDAGEIPDGWIVLPLSTLSRFSGNAPAPTTLRPGDKILIIDPEESRATIVRVTP